MKLTNREKILLALAAVILAAVGVYYFLFQPFLEEYNFWVEEHSKYNSQLTQIQSNILPPGEQRDLIRTFKRKVELLERALPPVVHQEAMIVELREVFQAHELEVESYSFNDSSLETDEDVVAKDSIDVILNSYENSLVNKLSTGELQMGQVVTGGAGVSQPAEQEESTGPETSTFSTSMSMRGKYVDLKEALREIEGLEQKVVIDSLSLAKDPTEKDVIVANVDLSYHYYYDGELLDQLDWAFASTLESFNPFDYIVKGSPADPDAPEITVPTSSGGLDNLSNILQGGGTTPTIPDIPTEPERPLVQLPEMDFGITMNSPDSVDFDYIIEKAGQRHLALGSNKRDEAMLLELQQIGDQYYYRYGNSYRMFPGGDQYDLFIPNGEAIVAHVVSIARKDTNDVGSARINLINNTDLKLLVYVRYDDDTYPRAEINPQSGDITVLRVDY